MRAHDTIDITETADIYPIDVAIHAYSIPADDYYRNNFDISSVCHADDSASVDSDYGDNDFIVL